MKIDTPMIVGTVVLALLVWMLLHALNMDLDAAGTLVVVGLCAGIVQVGRWAWSKRGTKEGVK